jgi:transforming growth factor-beta-induced protein
MKKIVLGILTAVFMLFATPVSAAGHETIVDIAVGNDDFSILVAALTEAELVTTLQSEGPFTVFAPTNAAFEKLLGELGIGAADLLASPRLTQVLLYHVVPGKVMSSDLSNGLSAATVLGESVSFDLTGALPKVNDSGIVAVDIEATNGVIHVIDTVLVPAAFFIEFDTVVDIALSSPDFSILVAALQRANLVNALLGDGPFTVFAPTNAAFEALLADLGVTADDLLAQSGLADVLLAHVVSGKVMSTDLTQGLQAPTLNSSTRLTFGLNPVTINSDIAVIAADLQALNGVVHVIDKVIIPANFVLDAVEEEPAATNLTLGLILGGLVAAAVAFVIITNQKSGKA